MSIKTVFAIGFEGRLSTLLFRLWSSAYFILAVRMRPWNKPASVNDYNLCKCWLYNVCTNIGKQNERVWLKQK